MHFTILSLLVLLNGERYSNFAGHRRKHHSTAVAAATARRDELQELLEQEKNSFIADQAVLAQQPDVSYSSRPSVHEASQACHQPFAFREKCKH